MSLLAAATLGVSGAATVRAEIRGEPVSTGAMRLIVQTYEASAGEIPERGRPLASVQRAVTAEELRTGVEVSLVQLAGGSAARTQPLVVAWVERGKPDLELDARLARPNAGSMVGLARGEQVRIQLARLSG